MPTWMTYTTYALNGLLPRGLLLARFSAINPIQRLLTSILNTTEKMDPLELRDAIRKCSARPIVIVADIGLSSFVQSIDTSNKSTYSFTSHTSSMYSTND